MANNPRKRKKLSKHLLEMKFMKRSRERIQKETDEEEGRAMFYSNISDQLKSSSSKFILEPSWVICEESKSGRRSFKGMNPIIEKLNELNSETKYYINSYIKEEKEEDVDITASEMAQIRHL